MIQSPTPEPDPITAAQIACSEASMVILKHMRGVLAHAARMDLRAQTAEAQLALAELDLSEAGAHILTQAMEIEARAHRIEVLTRRLEAMKT